MVSPPPPPSPQEAERQTDSWRMVEVLLPISRARVQSARYREEPDHSTMINITKNPPKSPTYCVVEGPGLS